MGDQGGDDGTTPLTTSPDSDSDAGLRSWWHEASTLTALRASAQLIWPTFVEWNECVFWIPPFASVSEWQEWAGRYGPTDWAALPLAERRVVAAQLGEQPLGHLPRVQQPVEIESARDLVDELFTIIAASWPRALELQFPGRTFTVTAVDRGDGLTVRLAETT